MTHHSIPSLYSGAAQFNSTMRRLLCGRRYACRTLLSFVLLLTFVAPPPALFPVQTLVAQEKVPFHVPNGFTIESVATGLALPTSFAFAGPNRIFVTEKSGRVRVIEDGLLLDEPFIDLSGEVNDVGQRGLLGIAVHPRFPATPYLYLAYVYDDPAVLDHNPEGARVSRLLRISADANNLNVHVPGSGVVILGKNSTYAHIGDPDRPEKNPLSCEISDGNYIDDCLPNEGHVHPLAHLAFGRDGALYVANGDGLNYNYGSLRAQAIDSLAGKILRINPITGDGYATNPFYDGNPQSNRSKVYVYGMKHPYRFAVHPTTGELFVGDVGNFKWEELNRVRAGDNLGWPCFEGRNPNAFDPVCQPLLDGDAPVAHGFHVYSHEEGWGAVIGGDFYTARAYPAYYRNAYFYGDFNKGTIQSVIFSRLGVPTYADFATGLPGLVQVSSAPDGALYVLSVVTGTLYRIPYVGGNTPFSPNDTADGASNAKPTPTAAATTAVDSNQLVDSGADGAGDAERAAQSEEADSASVDEEPLASATDVVSAEPTVVSSPGAGTGTILREWWEGVGGKTVADLTASDAYAGKPSGREALRMLDAPRLFGSDYGTRIRGYLHPPVTGTYRFWIAADDSAELWLSTDDNPTNKRKIAAATDWTHAQQWDRQGSQQSALIRLTAGERYYIEVLHKQADQKDNLSVAWEFPGQERAVIDGAYLSPPE